MKHVYNTSRAVAIAMGALATTGAVAILTEEPIRSGVWTLDHILAPAVVAITIAAGHMFSKARRDWRGIYAAGFAVAFLSGTAYTLYNSVGRQAAVTAAADLTATARNAALADRIAARAKVQVLLDEAQAGLGKACEAGDATRRCMGAMATITAHKATVAEHTGVIAELGPSLPVAPRASRAAQVLGLMGVDEAAARRMLILIEPFLLALFLEIAAIVSFGFAFSSTGRVPTPHAARFATANVVPMKRRAKTPEGQTVIDALAKSGRPLSNRELALAIGVSEGEATKRREAVKHLLTVGKHGRELRIAVA